MPAFDRFDDEKAEYLEGCASVAAESDKNIERMRDSLAYIYTEIRFLVGEDAWRCIEPRLRAAEDLHSNIEDRARLIAIEQALFETAFSLGRKHARSRH